MFASKHTGNLDFSLWLTGGLSQGCPDFQKVYVFKVYVAFSCPIDRCDRAFRGGCSAILLLHLKNPRILRKFAATRVARQGVPAHVCNYVDSIVSRSIPGGGTDFPAAIYLAGKCPNLGRNSISCCWKIGGRIFQQRRY